LLVSLLAWAWWTHAQVPLVAWTLHGASAAVVAVIALGSWRMGRR
jgi:hypothetical protein